VSSISREEALRRIENDPGDPADSVWKTIHRGKRACYHDNPDCAYAGRKTTLTTRGTAQDIGRPPCAKCVLDEEDDD